MLVLQATDEGNTMKKTSRLEDALIILVALMNLADLVGWLDVPAPATAAGTALMTVILVRAFNRDRQRTDGHR